MILRRPQSLALAAIFSMAGVALFASDAQPTGGSSPVQQSQAASPQPSSQSGQLAPSLVVPTRPPALDDAANGPFFQTDQITGFSVARPTPGETPPSASTPQNRVIPANVDNTINYLPGEAAYSANWLVDGVARVEADEKRQRAGNARDGKFGGKADEEVTNDPITGKPERPRDRERDTDTTGDNKSGTAANDPLVQYLQKWMTTSSGAAAATVASQPSESGNSQYQAVPGTATGVDAASAAIAAQNVAAAARTVDSNYITVQMAQPMLAGSGPSITLRPPSPISPAGAADAMAPATDSASQTPVGVPENAVLKLKANDQNLEPTKPILNDRKYFPQLQRF